jgi:methyl-accepting chemotaxis protein
MNKIFRKTESVKGIMWFTSIRARIVYVLLVCIILATITSFSSILPQSKNSLIEASENNMMDLANVNVRLLDKSIEAVNETMNSVAHSQELNNFVILGGLPYRSEDVIKTYLRDNPEFTSITVYDKQGKAILSTDEATKGSDGSSLSYIKKVLETGKAAQSDIIVKNVKKPSIICSIPLLSTSDDTMGVISVTVPAEYITNILNKTKLKNIQSSYSYLVSPDGYIIYHPKNEMIGTVTTNKIIKDAMSQIKAGKIPDAKAVEYEDGGTTKYASYSVSESNHWILVITADKNDILTPINKMVQSSTIILGLLLIVLGIISYILASTITKPIKIMTKAIIRISEMKFKADASSDVLCKRRDEIGEMSRVMQKMRVNMREIIESINNSSEQLNKNADNLDHISNNVSSRSDENSITVQQLLAGMEETSSTTESINENITNIENGTKDIDAKSLEGIKLANEIVQRAAYLQENTTKAVERIKNIFEEVKAEASGALEQSKAVKKIEVLTKTITDISARTKLLSLNASIEAARAGESGKGFAVVAGEIGSLSSQSADTVNKIIPIVGEVTVAVNSIDSCLHKMLDLIENMILPDYQEYISVSNQYNKDAEIFHDTMSNINKEMERLSAITNEITHAISEIGITINVSTEEMSDISRRTADIAQMTIETYNKAKESKVFAQELKNVVNIFEL